MLSPHDLTLVVHVCGSAETVLSYFDSNMAALHVHAAQNLQPSCHC